MRTWTILTPLFGKLYLVPHLASEVQPKPPLIGYVDFGDETKLSQGIFIDSAWRDRKMRPLAGEVVHWYHVEKPDGSRPF